MLQAHEIDQPQIQESEICPHRFKCAKLCEPETEQVLYMHGFRRVVSAYGFCYLVDVPRDNDN